MFAMNTLQYVLVLLFLCFLFTVVRSSDENIVSVRIKNSKINGKIVTSVDGRPVNVFKGIPYAEPPLGALRFRKPLPVRQWPESIDAFDWPNPCYQNATLFDIEHTLMNKNLSEDCLYLNIWSPSIDEKSDVLKPVMFWIHGGGLLVGSASQDLYEGQVLADKGDVVLVTVSYRLNIFGFFYTGTDEAPGNVGFWDQALAIEWVSDNIRYFGGDPDQITLFGESAGGWSIGSHIISPVSRHLFKNAVINSAAYLYNFADDRPEDHMKKWLKGAELIGCTDEQNADKFSSKIMECLREVDSQKLVEIVDMPQFFTHSIKLFTLVVTDGVFLPKRSIEMLRSGDFKQNLNLMVSTTGEEGTFLLAFMHDIVKYNPFTPKNLTYSEAYNELSQIASGISSHVPINGENVAKLYFTGLSDSNDFDLLRRTIGIAVGDYYVTCSTLEFAKQVFRHSNYKANVYQYLYNSKLPEIPFCSNWMGVCHASDEFAMFGTPFLSPDDYPDRQREISAQVIQFLTDFAKTGVPTRQNGIEWPKYYQVDDHIITPLYEISTEPKPDTNFRTGFKINECDYLWKKHFDPNVSY